MFVRTLAGEIVAWPPGAQMLFGFSAERAIGRTCFELLSTRYPSSRSEVEAELLSAGCWAGQLEHTCEDGLQIWTETRLRLAYDGAGRALVVETSADVSRRELLAKELDHRVKNILTVVQGLARSSFAKSDPTDVCRFEERLVALSKAHDLLLENRWQEADLGELLQRVATALNFEHRLTASGPPVSLSPDLVVSYALALHELGTNAFKHGALASPAGKVDVKWTIVEDHPTRLRLTWRESGGPPVRPPTHQGFGSRLIQRAMQNAGAKVSVSFPPEGFVFMLDDVPTTRTSPT